VIDKNIPYWRLSSFYWFYFATLGAFIPYLGLYLFHLEYPAVEIGQLMAVIMGTKIIAPYLWGWVVDHQANRLMMIRLGACLATMTYAGIFWVESYWWLLLVFFVFSFFWNAILPQFEALTLNHLPHNEHQYSWIRMWGSIGFVIAVTMVGVLLNSLPIVYLPHIVFLLLIGIVLSTFLVTDHSGIVVEQQCAIVTILKNKSIMAFLMACLFVQASHGPYYTFYTLYAGSQGYNNVLIGFLWAIAVLSEVIAFMLMPWLTQRFELRILLLSSLLLGTFRWLLIGYFIDNIYLAFFAQFFHAATFGIYHAVAIAYIHQYFKGNNQGKGQALYSSVSFGIGGALGSLYGGYLWESIGASLTFTVAALFSLIAFIISWLYVPKIKSAIIKKNKINGK
jgi:PPP family 3-phenylpropionic acid transporter